MKRFILSIVFFIIALAFFIPSLYAGKKADTLNVAFSKELQSTDRYYSPGWEAYILSQHLYDNLFYRDPITFEYKGLLAKSHRWISDTELEIKLRQGVQFHNGAEMTADDVVYILNYAANPDHKAYMQRFHNWIKEVVKTGPYGVKIFLKDPMPTALEFLCGANPIYPKDYYSKVGKKGFGLKPIGTGPYKMIELEPAKKYVMVKNDDYFKDSPKGQPSIGKIVWRNIPTVSTQIAELMTGSLDWIYLVPADQAKNLAKRPNIRVVAGETMRIGWLGFDSVNRTGREHGMANPFKNVKVRQAINHAINKEAISKNLLGGQSRPVYSACNPTQFGCEQDVKKYEYNPEKAKKLLADAGYPNGFETTFLAYRARPLAEAMVGDLANVGIKANMMYMKAQAARKKITTGKAQFYFWTWGSNGIGDISAITSNFFEFGADDLARDAQVKDWLVAGDSTMDPAKRKAHYSKALKRIAEQAYWCPLFTFVNNNCFSKDLDFTPHRDSVPRFFLAKWK